MSDKKSRLAPAEPTQGRNLGEPHPMELKEITLSPAKRTDYPVVQDITRQNMQSLLDRHIPDWDRESFEADFLKDSNFIICSGGEKVGCLSYSQDGDTLFIRSIQDLARYQGHGIGTSVMNSVEGIARDSGLLQQACRIFQKIVLSGFTSASVSRRWIEMSERSSWRRSSETDDPVEILTQNG